MTLMSQLFGQAQDVVTIAGFAAGLVVYAPWLIALLCSRSCRRSGRGALQRAELLARSTRRDARAARARLRAADPARAWRRRRRSRSSASTPS
jgi:hypothetical protein